MNEERMKKIAKEHAEYMSTIYYLIFIHGYKHGYEDKESEK